MSAQHGDPRLPYEFWNKTLTHPNGCWLWIGWQTPKGYGGTGDGRRGTRTRAHVRAYRALVGDYAEGLELDHLCRIRICCNPDHLEPVTPEENTRRGKLARRAMAKPPSIAPGETCKHGHSLELHGRLCPERRIKYCNECKRLATKRAWRLRNSDAAHSEIRMEAAECPNAPQPTNMVQS